MRAHSWLFVCDCLLACDCALAWRGCWIFTVIAQASAVRVTSNPQLLHHHSEVSISDPDQYTSYYVLIQLVGDLADVQNVIA